VSVLVKRDEKEAAAFFFFAVAGVFFIYF